MARYHVEVIISEKIVKNSYLKLSEWEIRECLLSPTFPPWLKKKLSYYYLLKDEDADGALNWLRNNNKIIFYSLSTCRMSKFEYDPETEKLIIKKENEKIREADNLQKKYEEELSSIMCALFFFYGIFDFFDYKE